MLIFDGELQLVEPSKSYRKQNLCDLKKIDQSCQISKKKKCTLRRFIYIL